MDIVDHMWTILKSYIVHKIVSIDAGLRALWTMWTIIILYLSKYIYIYIGDRRGVEYLKKYSRAAATFFMRVHCPHCPQIRLSSWPWSDHVNPILYFLSGACSRRSGPLLGPPAPVICRAVLMNCWPYMLTCTRLDIGQVCGRTILG